MTGVIININIFQSIWHKSGDSDHI